MSRSCSRLALPFPRDRRWLAWLMAAMLVSQLLWQSMGQMHGVVHAPGLRTAVVATDSHADGGWVAEMFGSHADDGACRLVDQLGCGDALPASPLVLPMPLPAGFVLALASGEALARWAALFDARGPPPVR